MYFQPDTPLQKIKEWLDVQVPAIYNAAKYGIEINVIAHKSKRTNEQNRFLMVVCTQIAKLHHETGYCCPGLQPWAMQPIIIKEYWKHRYGTERSSNLDKTEFTKFIDFIQQTMVEETCGNWEIITTDSAYLRSLYE